MRTARSPANRWSSVVCPFAEFGFAGRRRIRPGGAGGGGRPGLRRWIPTRRDGRPGFQMLATTAPSTVAKPGDRGIPGRGRRSHLCCRQCRYRGSARQGSVAAGYAEVRFCDCSSCRSETTVFFRRRRPGVGGLCSRLGRCELATGACSPPARPPALPIEAGRYGVLKSICRPPRMSRPT